MPPGLGVTRVTSSCLYAPTFREHHFSEVRLVLRNVPAWKRGDLCNAPPETVSGGCTPLHRRPASATWPESGQVFKPARLHSPPGGNGVCNLETCAKSAQVSSLHSPPAGNGVCNGERSPLPQRA